MCSVSQETRSFVYDDFAKIHIEFIALSADMSKVANELKEILRKRRKFLGLFLITTIQDLQLSWWLP